MKIKFLKLKLILFLIFIATFNSKASEYFTNPLSTRNGLSQNDVHTIFQDSRKFIWICTNDGLNRYDGYDFKIYNKGYKGLESSLIETIAEDKNNNLWIGTADKGLFYYNRLSDTFINIASLSNLPSQNFPNNTPRIFIDDQNSTIWFYNTNSEFYKISLDKNFKKVTRITQFKAGTDGLRSTSIFSMIKDFTGRLWIGTSNGLHYYNYKTATFKSISTIPNQVYSLSIIDKSKIAINTEKKILIFDTENFSNKKSFDISTDSRLLYANNQLWLASSTGIYIAEYNRLTNNFSGVSKIEEYNNWICNSLIMDANGVVWVGFGTAGIRQYKLNKKPFLHFGNESPIGNNFISSIIQDRFGGLWVGTFGTGVFRFPQTPTKAQEKDFVKADFIKQNTIYTLAQSKISDNIYIGSEGANNNLYEYNINTKKLEPINITKASVRIIFTDSCFLWIGTYNDGLFRYNLTTKEILHINKGKDFPSNIVRNIIKDSKGNIWLGTSDGICVIPSANKYSKNLNVKLIHYNNGYENKVINEYVISICQSKDGNIWLGTLGDGIKVITNLNSDFKCELKTYTIDNGLSNNTIKNIIEDNNGNIWISTNKGLNKIDQKNGTVQLYDISDGLQDYEFNELSGTKCKNGAILFGGVNGLNLFYPNQMQIDTLPPTLVITDFLLAGQSVKVNEKYDNKIVLSSDVSEVKKIELSYNQNNFSFVFAGIHYLAPRKNQYRYKLNGFDIAWTKDASNNRIAKYTNIPPGEYQFLLEGSNNNGIWTKEPLVVQVIIHPPFWVTWYAYLIYVIILLAATIQFRNFLIKRQRQRNEVYIANLEKVRTKELMDMKVNFFTNISHEFRTPLTLILSPLQTFMSDLNIPESVRNNSAIKTIEHNANILLKLINHLLNITKHDQQKLEVQLKNKNFTEFIRQVIQQFDFLAQSQNISLKFKSNSTDVFTWFDPFLMEQILYNLISNAFKYTPTGGEINLLMVDSAENVILSISDTGIGISKEAQNHVFERFFSINSSEKSNTGSSGIGLALTKNLVELHHGTINFESELGKGTTFTLNLPKNFGNGNNVQTIDKPNIITENILTVSDDNDSDLENEDLNKTLLVVDDNPQIITLLTGLFSSQYKVLSAENGQVALDIIYEFLPDIIISDVMMPVMDGLRLCKTIKNDIKISHIPIILLSAKASIDNQTEGYNYNADGYCPKPFDNNLLVALVNATYHNKQRLAQRFRGEIDISPTVITTTNSDEKFLRKLIKIIEDRIDDSTLTVEDLYSEVGMSANNLNKKLKALTNTTTKLFIRNIRLKRAAQLLKLQRFSVTDVAYEVGFSDLKHFRECFKKEFGVAPSDYKNENADQSQNEFM